MRSVKLLIPRVFRTSTKKKYARKLQRRYPLTKDANLYLCSNLVIHSHYSATGAAARHPFPPSSDGYYCFSRQTFEKLTKMKPASSLYLYMAWTRCTSRIIDFEMRPSTNILKNRDICKETIDAADMAREGAWISKSKVTDSSTSK